MDPSRKPRNFGRSIKIQRRRTGESEGEFETGNSLCPIEQTANDRIWALALQREVTNSSYGLLNSIAYNEKMSPKF
jgi:hypothetical protein